MEQESQSKHEAGPNKKAGDQSRGGARKQVPLRLDPGIYAAVAKWASDDLRSVNAQIEVLLRRALQDAGRMPKQVQPLRGPGRPPKDEA